jgi:hypothetical protein
MRQGTASYLLLALRSRPIFIPSSTAYTARCAPAPCYSRALAQLGAAESLTCFQVFSCIERSIAGRQATLASPACSRSVRLMIWPRFAAFVVSEGDAGHHIIATSADHSLSLPLLLSLWFFGLFNNHVSSHTVRRLVAHLTQHDRPRSYTICSLELINRGSGILRSAALSSTPAKNSVRVPLPPSTSSLLITRVRYRLQRVPISALGEFLGFWLMASGGGFAHDDFLLPTFFSFREIVSYSWSGLDQG